MKLELSGVTAGYGKHTVLKNLSFSPAEHRITVLLGPNGSGKSTLLRCCGRLLKADSGSICADGRPLWSIPGREYARHAAFLPQSDRAPEGMTVEELVRFGRYPHGGENGKRDQEEIIEEILSETRLVPLRSRLLSALSGGELRRAWCAMILAQEPEFLLLDEPTAYLDPRCQYDLIRLVCRRSRQFGTTVVMILHDLNLAALCADEVLLMKEGRILFSGSPQEAMTPQHLRETFDLDFQLDHLADGRPNAVFPGLNFG